MEEIYPKIWELAKSYYLKGRPMDIDHVEWMMEQAKVLCQKEDIDKTLLMPLVILHDVGYGETGPAYFEKDLKKDHMIAGKKISREILEKVNYPEDKIKIIENYISIHDNWIYGEYEIYKENNTIGSFSDLDYMWMATPKGFEAVRKIIHKSKKEMIEFIMSCDKLKYYSFVTKTAKELFEKYMSERKKETDIELN
ncbi:HD domain-containing protein [archaeon]|jgi:hypothetical protein|nr:HD domain-containing protein [archaeon]MBT4022159.1 HD domain-containing protein [archaeon]MBT4272772.1 HD domain-containing protein [archaeon]MBT4461571.1 HD domain-containing protein [archaeon]MBT4857661.1 HD domain-containing protein [archaeon]